MKKWQWLTMAVITIGALGIMGCDTGGTGTNGSGLDSAWSGVGSAAKTHRADDFGDKVSGVDSGGPGGGPGNAGAFVTAE